MKDFPKLTVTQKAEKSLRGGHPWVFGEEVLRFDRPYENGDLVHVYSEKDKYLGTGFVNDRSKIRVRVISKNANDLFDEAFFERRIRHAVEYRLTVMGDDFDACRLIFGEADYFPGFTVDKFHDILVTEVLSLGIEKRKDMLYRLLVSVLASVGVKISAIYERNESEIRKLEGMEQNKGFYPGDGLKTDLDGFVSIKENGVSYTVDYVNGQKTGFFLDQKYNRLAVSKLAKGKHVLDCFTHTGSFGLNAAFGGAASVLSLDISEDAIEMAKKNAKDNHLDGKIEYLKVDVFDYLTALKDSKKQPFDLIILDPPAFTKSRDTLKNAIRGYKEINLKAMQILPRGGYLATCSCSHFMQDTYFKQMLHAAAEDAGVSLRQIEVRTQSPDHPILWNVPETFYLKFYIFQIV